MGKTLDERFVLRLYELAIKSGDVHAPIDRYEVGKLCGLHPKGVNNICKLLMQANFIKKSGEKEIMLTTNGERLVSQLLGE